MGAEIAFRDVRVIEVVGRVMSHAKAAHHRTGAGVRLSRVGDDLVETELIEGETRCGARCFSCEAESPGRS